MRLRLWLSFSVFLRVICIGADAGSCRNCPSLPSSACIVCLRCNKRHDFLVLIRPSDPCRVDYVIASVPWRDLLYLTFLLARRVPQLYELCSLIKNLVFVPMVMRSSCSLSAVILVCPDFLEVTCPVERSATVGEVCRLRRSAFGEILRVPGEGLL